MAKPQAKEVKYSAFVLIEDPNLPFSLIQFTRADLRLTHLIRATEADFADVVQRVEHDRAIIEVSKVEVSPTAFFGLLLQLASSLRERGIRVRACGMNTSTQRVFQMLDMEHLLPIFDTFPDAKVAPWVEEKKKWWPFGKG